MQIVILTAVLTLVAGAAIAADPVVGLWASEANEDGTYEHIAFSEFDTKLCAKLIRSFDSAGAVLTTGNEGKLIVWGMKAEGRGRYSGGKLDLPFDGSGPGGSDGQDDTPLAAKMRLSGERLTLSGCLMGGLICGQQVWTRAE